MLDQGCFYNEWDRYAAAWLRQLIEDGLISRGVVDERSITDITADELAGYRRIHLFSGIGGWELALKLAGWPDDRPVLSASLPCQPFSQAGKQLGKADERHLLPHFLELVRRCKPPIIFGEQVEGAVRHGWLDDLCTNLESEGYTVRAAVLGAHSAGSVHIRQRLYWVAHRNDTRLQGWLSGRQNSARENMCGRFGRSSTDSRLAYANGEQTVCTDTGRLYAESGSGGRLGNAELSGLNASEDRRSFGESESRMQQLERPSTIERLGNPEHDGYVAGALTGSDVQTSEEWRQDGAHVSGQFAGTSGRQDASDLPASVTGGENWTDRDWLYCRDQKYRAIKSGLKPLVDGLSAGMVCGCDKSPQKTEINPDNTGEARTMRLKGYGNAIVPQVAALFIRAVMEEIDASEAR